MPFIIIYTSRSPDDVSHHKVSQRASASPNSPPPTTPAHSSHRGSRSSMSRPPHRTARPHTTHGRRPWRPAIRPTSAASRSTSRRAQTPRRGLVLPVLAVVRSKSTTARATSAPPQHLCSCFAVSTRSARLKPLPLQSSSLPALARMVGADCDASCSSKTSSQRRAGGSLSWNSLTSRFVWLGTAARHAHPPTVRVCRTWQHDVTTAPSGRLQDFRPSRRSELRSPVLLAEGPR